MHERGGVAHEDAAAQHALHLAELEPQPVELHLLAGGARWRRNWQKGCQEKGSGLGSLRLTES